MDNRIRSFVTAPGAAQRSQELQQRTSTHQRMQRDGQEMQANAVFIRRAALITGAGATAAAGPLFAMFPPLGAVSLYAIAASGGVLSGAERKADHAQAMLAHSAERFNKADYDALFAAEPQLAWRTLSELHEAGLIKIFELSSAHDYGSTMYSVNPKAAIAEGLRAERFDYLSDGTRTLLRHFLQKVLEMAPIVEACDDVERQMQIAIKKRDNEKTKLLSEQLLTLRACWASDGKTPVVHDAAFDTKAEHRMLADLRKKLGEEMERGTMRNMVRIRQLQADIKRFESLVMNEDMPAADLIDLNDVSAKNVSDTLIDL